MDDTRRFLQGMNLPGHELNLLPDSPSAFLDGGHYRVEIPGVESREALDAVVETAREVDLIVHRVTALGGIMLLPDQEIRAMADLGAAQRIEVCLAVGPRAPYGAMAGPRTPDGAGRGWRLCGTDELVYAIEDVRRAVALGIRSVLVADEGLLWVLREMKTSGVLPDELALRASSHIGACNPASIWLLEELGAASYALPPDLTVARIATMRAAVDMPLEVAVECSGVQGGFVRLYEAPEFVRVAAPLYLSYDLRVAPEVSPGGSHVAGMMVSLCRERVRRARLGQNMLERYLPHVVASPRGAGGVALPIYVAS